ncbi:hypothetical protein NCHU2750_16690 [Neorhizobium sp. NCHU2750]|nr:hypothetical protein NCHU2750_16690 [Neorhizobium sp. NCHU2750]
MAKTAELWHLDADVGPLSEGPGCPRFDVEVTRAGQGWKTSSRIFMLDHDAIVAHLASRSLPVRLVGGFLSAAAVIREGGASGYFRHAWRFGLFFIFPFLLIGLGLMIGLALAVSPHWLGLSPWFHLPAVVLGLLFFLKAVLPYSERYHTLHLLSDWDMAVAVARLDDPVINAWIDDAAQKARAAFDEAADEYVVTSHSMGSSMAAHVIGRLLEREPDLFDGKRVVFVTLGGAILQCALMRSARVLRARVGLITRAKNLGVIEVQCLTDPISFYKSSVTELTGNGDAPPAKLIFLRIRNMLERDRYRKIKRDFLRVHRQYVLGSDRKTHFDFGLMTSGPLPASSFDGFSSPDALDQALGRLSQTEAA